VRVDWLWAGGVVTATAAAANVTRKAKEKPDLRLTKPFTYGSIGRGRGLPYSRCA